jgi:hypothetical protein
MANRTQAWEAVPRAMVEFQARCSVIAGVASLQRPLVLRLHQTAGVAMQVKSQHLHPITMRGMARMATVYDRNADADTSFWD